MNNNYSNPSLSLTDLFPHRVCINLDRRPERWKRMQARFAETGIAPVNRFPALDAAKLHIPPGWTAPPGGYGCQQSHIEVVRRARAEGWPCVLIFEDDVVFADDFGGQIRECCDQVPADWDMLLFGGIHCDQPISVSDHVVRVTKTYSTYAYALRDSIYDSFIALNTRCPRPVDDNTVQLQERFNCYCFMPHLAWVDEDYSDAQGRRVNFWWLKESLVLGGGAMDRMLERAAVIIRAPAEVLDARTGLRNLRYLIGHYSQLLDVAVVRYGKGLSGAARMVGSNCRFEHLADTERDDLNTLLDKALSIYGPEKELFLLVDCNTFLKPVDVRANLLMCLGPHSAVAVRRFASLTPEDTRKLMTGGPAEVKPDGYRMRKFQTLRHAPLGLAKSALDRVAERNGDNGRVMVSESTMGVPLNAFESPALAYRLSL